MSRSSTEVDWTGFEKYLGATKSSKMRMLYARKYGSVLFTQDAQPLLMLPEETRKNVMKSLAALSKFLGCYDVWQQIKQKYQLKWSDANAGLAAFEEIFRGERALSTMMQWLQQVTTKLPSQYSNILIYSTLTGLRPDEACQSLHLLKSNAENYFNKEKMVLEHYHYPSIFIRRTKKAYISLVSNALLKLAEECGDYNYNTIRLAVRREDMEMHMKYCRSIFATSLRKAGIESELIDLLQGRVPKTVFARHYFRPDFEQEKVKVLAAINKLHKEIG